MSTKDVNSKDFSKEDAQASAGNKPGSQEQLLQSLFSHVTARERAPAEDETAVRKALHSEWLEITRRTKRRKYFTYSLAASVVLATVVGFNLVNQNRPALPLQQIAELKKQSGDIFVHQIGGQSSGSTRLSNSHLYAGQVLNTGQNARLAIEMSGGETLKINENTRLAFTSANQLELLSGQIYVDSHQSKLPIGGNNSLLIKTNVGVIQHLGTQYLATSNDSGVTISVREGKVLLATNRSETITTPGQQLNIGRSGEISIIAIATHGPIWEWTELVTPEFTLDGRSAHDFITWVGRETGHKVQYAPDGAELLAHSTELRGSFDLQPMRALELMLQTSDLEPIVENGSILIRKRKGNQ